MQNYKITVTVASGVEGAVKSELRALGFPYAKSIDGGITVDGTALDVARLNMFLHSADRVYISLGSFLAETFDELFDGVNGLNLCDILPFNAKIIVNGKCKKSKLFAISSCQAVVKKAILSSLSRRYRRNIFPENGETYRFEFVINENVATLYLNTSGDGLHKRGWRDLVGEAPIKETLASAMLTYSEFSSDTPFCDPFCGSGTIVIEGARKALGIAPGRDRTFDYAKWDFFDEKVYALALEEARDKENHGQKLAFYGFDISKNAISLAIHHAKRAGVSEYIHLQVQDVKDLRISKPNGVIVTNPPYGERLLDGKGVREVYETLGKVYRSLDNWGLYAITSYNGFEKSFGKKADRNRKLYNAGLECHFYSYPKAKRQEKERLVSVVET